MNLSLSEVPIIWQELPAQRRFELQLRVMADDLDDLNHVNNTVYLEWCEQVARQHALSLGLGTGALVELGAVPVAHEHRIRYQRPALLGDQVRVRTALTFSQGARSTRLYTIDRLNPDRLNLAGSTERLAECQTDWVWIDPATGRPKRQPSEVRSRFAFT